jgi:predicted Rossmann fold flavoprotein
VIDAVILGGGAAGLFCASIAASTGRSVVVLEHNDRPGKKIRISGGGRCNFTNREVTHRSMVSANPDFARSALARYRPDDFIALVERHGIAWHEKTLGQLFCDGSAQQIIDMLLAECAAAGAEVRMRSVVREVSKSDHFTVTTDDGELHARAVVVATGGLSIPSLGATGMGYRIAEHFGLSLEPTVPALVPLTIDVARNAQWVDLAGVSLDAIVSAHGASFRENILFTHRGLSGPAILQISSYIDPGDAVSINVLPGHTLSDLVADLPGERRHLGTVLAHHLPSRFVDAWPNDELHRPVNTVPKVRLESAIAALQSWDVPTNGNEGYAKAEVTRGGVSTHELSSKTMEAKRVPGLYFIGEVVDITGWLGGYNFQWAWSSAYAAGTAIAMI